MIIHVTRKELTVMIFPWKWQICSNSLDYIQSEAEAELFQLATQVLMRSAPQVATGLASPSGGEIYKKEEKQ